MQGHLFKNWQCEIRENIVTDNISTAISVWFSWNHTKRDKKLMVQRVPTTLSGSNELYESFFCAATVFSGHSFCASDAAVISAQWRSAWCHLPGAVSSTAAPNERTAVFPSARGSHFSEVFAATAQSPSAIAAVRKGRVGRCGVRPAPQRCAGIAI